MQKEIDIIREYLLDHLHDEDELRKSLDLLKKIETIVYEIKKSFYAKFGGRQ